MKTIHKLRIGALAIVFMIATACSTQNTFKGSASDRTGNNGATNGTGKVYK
ncbi:MAG TPA: hypothetical protein VF581_06165 [Flavobacterium sp.]|jgi:hypothetical protein